MRRGRARPKAGELSGRTDEWIKHLHPPDREKLRLSLLSVQRGNGGTLQGQFRLRHSDGTYRWFELKATSVAGRATSTA